MPVEFIGLVGLASSIVTFLDISAKILAVIRECKAAATSNRFHDIEVQLPLLCETLKSLEDDMQLKNIDSAIATALQNATEGYTPGNCHRRSGQADGGKLHPVKGKTRARSFQTGQDGQDTR